MVESSGLLDKIPSFLSEYAEIRQIIAAEQQEFDILFNELSKAMDNQFVLTVGMDGIVLFEKMLGIIPKADESLEDRRFKIFGALNQKLPYTESKLSALLEVLCGKGEYSMEIDYEKCEIAVKIGLTAKNMVEEVGNLLQRMLPVNMLIELMLKYNTWAVVNAFRWEELKDKTWRQIYEDVLY